MSSPPLPSFNDLLTSIESPQTTHRFFCSTCSKGFSRKSDMARHEKKHGTENYMFCKICNIKKFYRRDSLKKHETSCEKKYNVYK